MYLEIAGTMYKQSYIQTNHVYAIPLSKLRLFNAQPFDNRLSQESYTFLTRTLNINQAPWIQTSKLQAGATDPSATATTLNAGVARPVTARIKTPTPNSVNESLVISAQSKSPKGELTTSIQTPHKGEEPSICIEKPFSKGKKSKRQERTIGEFDVEIQELKKLFKTYVRIV